MQKTAKNISLSIAGMMVAMPAGADIASVDYVQRWVQNQSPIPAGSVISGYASGSYGSYLLAGSTVGGPYSGVSISDLASKIPGSKITGYVALTGFDAYNIYSQFMLMSSADGSYGSVSVKDVLSLTANSMGSMLQIGTGSYVLTTHGSGVVYRTYVGALGSLLGFSSVTYFPGSFLMGSGSGTSPNYVPSSVVINGLVTGSIELSQSGVGMVIHTSGKLGTVPVVDSNSSRSLSAHLFKGQRTGTIGHILATSFGGTGVVPSYYSVETLGTFIGTVKGSQVKIEQTATAETLQANTGTIYFPVVQNGTIYGVTLNDFYILMNAQF